MHELHIILHIGVVISQRGVRPAGGVEGLERDDIAVVPILRKHIHGAGRLVVIDLIAGLKSHDGLQVRHDAAVRVEVVLVAVDILPALCGRAVDEVVLCVVDKAPAGVGLAVVA